MYYRCLHAVQIFLWIFFMLMIIIPSIFAISIMMNQINTYSNTKVYYKRKDWEPMHMHFNRFLNNCQSSISLITLLHLADEKASLMSLHFLNCKMFSYWDSVMKNTKQIWRKFFGLSKKEYSGLVSQKQNKTKQEPYKKTFVALDKSHLAEEN